MVRVALLFLIVAAFAVLVLSNLSPVALTFLGAKTLVLPLGVWVVGAIGAGALTTAIIAGLFRLARPASPASARRPSSSSRSADRFTANSFRNPWAGRLNRQGSKTTGSPPDTGSSTRTRTGEDRQSNPETAAWEDWEDASDLVDRKSASQTRFRDTEDDEWADWEGFEEGQQPGNNRDEGRERNSEQSDRPDRSSPPIGAPIPLRTDFEVKRDPETRRQSGSVYSYRYRRSDEDAPEAPPSTAKAGEVYDADYRVITPPYRPDPEEVMHPPDRFTGDRSTEIRDSDVADRNFDLEDFDLDSLDEGFDKGAVRNSSSNPDEDDEDWGLDDEPQDQGDRPRR
jgi:uncharacterized integral membrane protein